MSIRRAYQTNFPTVAEQLNSRNRRNLAVRARSGEGRLSLRVIRRLPVTWQCGALGGQASDNP